MPDSIYDKTRLFLCFSLLLIAFSSCQKNKSDELKLLDSFLQQNYTYNTKQINHQKGSYFKIVKKIPKINTKKFIAISFACGQITAQIDHAIISKESNIESLLQEYNEFLIDVKDILYKSYKEKLDINIKYLNFNTEYRLKMMKNNLIVAMIYAYKSRIGNTLGGHTGSRYIRVNTTVEQNEQQTKIVLISSEFQNIAQKKDITVDKITYNNLEKKTGYNIVDNYDFTDIILDSLSAGKYQIEGTIQYFNRNGKTAIPFRETFEVH